MDFYLDENIPIRIAMALNYLEGENRVHNIYSTVEKFGAGVSDLDLFQDIAKTKGIFITNDLKVAHKKDEAELLRELSIGTFLINFRQGASFWERVIMIMKNWVFIKETAKYYELKKLHFICRIKITGKPEITL